MRQPGQHATRQAHRRRREFLARSWQWIVVFAAIVTADAIAIVLGTRARFNVDTVNGFVLGVTLACGLWMGWLLFDRADGSRNFRLGATAEREVAAELDRLTKEGWHAVHGIRFEGQYGRPFDVDHVAVGPGGVIAIETKYTSTKIACGDTSRWMHDAIRQAERSSDRIRLLLRSLHFDVHSRPLVVISGPLVSTAGAQGTDPNAAAVRVDQLRPYLHHLPKVLDTFMVDGISEALGAFADAQPTDDAPDRPSRLPSPSSLP